MDDRVIERLLTEADPAVSIYMPLEPSQRDIRAPAARIRNLIRAAQESLQRYAGDDRHASLLAAANECVERTDFRLHRDPGVALFLADGRAEILRLPEPPPELVMTGRSFHIKPLLYLINRDCHFYILALSTGNLRLLAATPFSRKELPLTDCLPPEAAAEAHSQRAAEVAPDASATAEALQKPLLLQDWHRVATAVHKRLGGDQAPLVLAADPRVAGAFAETAQLPQMLPPLHFNPFAISEDELHARAMERIQPILQTARAGLLDQITARLGAGEPTVATRLDEILPAARDGRVDALVVAGDETVWGRFDADSGKVATAHGSPGRGEEDLLNLAAAVTLRQGGRALAVPRSELPGRYPAAAALRF